MSAGKAGKLLTQRLFLPLFTLFQTGTFNDNTLKSTLIALVLVSPPVIPALKSINVAEAALLFTGPFLILAAIAGQIAVKYDRGLILKTIKRVEFGIMVLASIGFLIQSGFIL